MTLGKGDKKYIQYIYIIYLHLEIFWVSYPLKIDGTWGLMTLYL